MRSPGRLRPDRKMLGESVIFGAKSVEIGTLCLLDTRFSNLNIVFATIFNILTTVCSGDN